MHRALQNQINREQGVQESGNSFTLRIIVSLLVIPQAYMCRGWAGYTSSSLSHSDRTEVVLAMGSVYCWLRVSIIVIGLKAAGYDDMSSHAEMGPLCWNKCSRVDISIQPALHAVCWSITGSISYLSITLETGKINPLCCLHFAASAFPLEMRVRSASACCYIYSVCCILPSICWHLLPFPFFFSDLSLICFEQQPYETLVVPPVTIW